MASGEITVQRRRSKAPRFLRRKTTGDVVFDVLNLTFLVVFCLTILYPFWMTLLLSFSSTDDATSLGFHLWIRKNMFELYIDDLLFQTLLTEEPTGAVGFVAQNGTATFEDLKG